jgi:hypothetical protein
MSLKSDVTVDASKFDRSGIDTQTLEFNQKLIKIWADGPRWYEVCFLSLFLDFSIHFRDHIYLYTHTAVSTASLSYPLFPF